MRNHPVVLVGPLLASRECGSIAPLSWRQFLADLAQIFASVANFSAYYIVTPAARSLAGVTGEALAAALPDCRPSPGPGTKGLAAHSTPRMLTRGEPTSLPPPPASTNREQKLTNKEEEEEGDRSTQQNSFSDFCIVA